MFTNSSWEQITSTSLEPKHSRQGGLEMKLYFLNNHDCLSIPPIIIIIIDWLKRY